MADPLGPLAIFGIVIGSLFGVWFLWELSKGFLVVNQQTVVIVERWGAFSRKCEAGLHFLIPFADRVRYITWRDSEITMSNSVDYRQSRIYRLDMRENVLDTPQQVIITRDNVEITVSPMIRFQLLDPVRVAYETYDLLHCVEKLVQTTLRSVIGDMGLDDTLASREEIQRNLTRKISSICKNWGLLIIGVELLEINPNYSIQEAMHMQIKAERTRRTAKVEAEGIAEQTKMLAEGDAQANKAFATGNAKVTEINAKGAADAKLLIAKSHADSLKIVGESLAEWKINPSHYLIALKYIEGLQSLALSAASRKIYFPWEPEVVGSFSNLMTTSDAAPSGGKPKKK
jgi:regulator of protease activity HflC (stomatin/prohibitin superfamily)